MLQTVQNAGCDFGRPFGNGGIRQPSIKFRIDYNTKIANATCGRKDLTSYPEKTFTLELMCTTLHLSWENLTAINLTGWANAYKRASMRDRKSARS